MKSLKTDYLRRCESPNFVPKILNSDIKAAHSKIWEEILEKIEEYAVGD